MLVAVIDPDVYLKSTRTQNRMIRILVQNLSVALGGGTTIKRIAGHRLQIDSDRTDAAERAARVFGIAAVEHVEAIPFTDQDTLADAIAEQTSPVVDGHTFAVRPRRIGTHDWNSQDLAVAVGSRLVARGNRVDLSHPEITVKVRVVDQTAYLTRSVTPAVGGLPLRTQGRALVLFSGGIDSPVAAFEVARRGVEVDYLHFSFGCGQADHAAGIAHGVWERYGAGSQADLIVVEFEHAAREIPHRVQPRDRQMALKSAMYRTAERIAGDDPGIRALVTGEALGQVSTQTLDNLVALDRVVAIPVLRPLLTFDKTAIRQRAEAIGTYDLSARTREMCDISDGARVATSMRLDHLRGVGEGLEDLIADAVASAKRTRLADWMPGTHYGQDH